MSGSPTLQDLLEVQQHFGLPSAALVEKDWYVVKALAAIQAADIAPARLVFGGGTALARAHKLIRRMSEDIDLKIIAEEPLTRPMLRQVRDAVTEALLAAGFDFDPDNRDHRDSANGTKYTIYRLPYVPIAAAQEAVLRPQIQIETAVWPVRRAVVRQPVVSFIAEAFKQSPEVAAMDCVSITETAAEKFVAITRRIGAELASAGGPRDPTQIRHLYDLHAIRSQYDLAQVAALAREIMADDVEAYGHQFSAYRDDPLGETLRAVEGLVASPEYAERYTLFRRDMVYGEAIEYEDSIATLKELAEHLAKV